MPLETAAPPTPVEAGNDRDAAARHRPRRALRRQRGPGRLLVHPRARLPRDRLRRARDRDARPLLARARAGPGALRAHRAAARDQRDRPSRRRHGDGVRTIALSVPDAEHAYRYAVQHGAHGVREPWEESNGDGSVRMATVATYGETLHTFVERNGYTGPFLPGFEPAPQPPAERGGHVRRHRPRRRQRRARPARRVGRLLRARLRDDRDDPLHRRGHRHRVLGADVEGDGRRQGPGQVPDQRARRGPAQVADRGVPRVLRRPRRPAHRPRDHRHRRHRRGAARAGASASSRHPTATTRSCPGGSARSTRTSPTCASSGSSSTATTRATCCRSSPRRSATGRPCSSR